MPSLFWTLFFLYLAVVGLWAIGMWWMRNIRTDGEMHLSPLPQAATKGPSPSLAVYIAAHNEQERIGACLERLCLQNYDNLQITIINDRSDDTTGEQVRAAMVRDNRIRLIEIDELPAGWIGKTYALAVGTAQAEADYLLFMDCDCRLVPGALAAVMHKVTAEHLEFVSLWPYLELLSPSEKIMAPAASWLLGIWAFLSTRRGSANTDLKLGNGQFMLFSREAYQKVGGHSAVQAELAEDMTLAGKVAALGLRRWAGLGKGLYVTSRDNTWSGTWNSLTRVLIGSLVDPWRILVSTQILLGGVLMPLWLLPLSLSLAIGADWTIGWAFAGACVVHLTAMIYVVRRLFSMTLELHPPLISFVLGTVLSVVLLAWAWLVVGGRGCVRWGKTAYRVHGSQITYAIPSPQRSAA